MPEPLKVPDPSVADDPFHQYANTLSQAQNADESQTATAAEPRFATPAREGELGTFGRYRVLQKLGQGGMGAVYLGYDASLARKVALKVMLPKFAADPDARERFLREARTAAMVRSDHVVTIFDVGEERGTPFIAMEYLLGYPLDQFLREKGELPLLQILRVGRETATGLAAAHALGMVHRDIKPANLWLEAPNGRVKLLDFGLARTEDDNTQLTGTGVVLGTPAYMSPEQGRGLAVDHRSDLFSVGVMLYRLCTGKMPFIGTNTMAILTSLAVDKPVPPRQLRPELPEELDAVIMRLLAKNPDERVQSAVELADALRAIEHPRPQTGVLPVVVTMPSLVVGAQTQNVWDGIDASESVPVPLATPVDTEAETRIDREAEPASDPELKPVPKKPARKPPARKASKLPAILACAALMAAVAVLAAILLRPSNGTLIVESDDADAEIVIKKDGEVVRDRTKDREFGLATGSYTLELAEPKPGLKLSSEKFEITKNGTSRVRLNADRPRAPGGKPPPAQPPPPLPPPTPTVDRQAAELVISLGGLVRLHTTDRGNARGYRDVAALPAGNLSLAEVHIDSREKPRVLADAVLANFKECKALTHVILQGCTVTDTGLAHLAGCAQLKQLSLYGPKVTDTGLAHFKGCAQLERLELHNTGASEAGLAIFKDCKNLTSLRLGNMKVSAKGLAAFKDCVNLQTLALDQTAVTASDLASFAGCKAIKDLDLSGTTVADDAFNHFKDCAGLVAVNLSGTKVSNGSLVFFKDSPTLRELNLGGTGVSGAGLAHLSGCSRLGILQLAGAKQVTDDAILSLKACPELYSVNLQNTAVTNNGLKHLEGLTGLQVLQLRGTNVNTEAARQLAEKLPDCRIEWDGGVIQPKTDPDREAAKLLWGVGLWSIFVSGKEVQDFNGPENFPLERFEMRLLYVNRNPAVTDDTFVCLKGCRHLVTAQITNVKVTDKTLTYLQDSKKLESLTLYATGVTDEGLKTLAGFKNLRNLNITQLNLSEPAVKALAAALPKCQIAWKGGVITPAN